MSCRIVKHREVVCFHILKSSCFFSPEELKRQNVALLSAENDVTRLQVQLIEANADMENIKAVAAVSETTKQEGIDDVKQQWQDEVASMHAIMKGMSKVVILLILEVLNILFLKSYIEITSLILSIYSQGP